METRSDSKIWLLGEPLDSIPGNKLPSMGQVLRRLFYLIRTEKKSAKDAGTTVSKEVIEIWEKARIPSTQDFNIVVKIRNLYEKYRKLQKGSFRRSPTQIKFEEDFVATVDDLFDVAHSDALSIITIEEDREFLLAQREKGRRGYMAGVDHSLAAKEARRDQRELQSKKRSERQSTTQELVELVSSSTSSSGSSSPEKRYDKDYVPNEGKSNVAKASAATSSASAAASSSLKIHRGTIDLVTPSLASALDRTGISNREASYVLAATVNALGLPTTDFKIGYESIRQARITHRDAIAAEIKKSFSPNVPLTVHWDSKIMEALDRQGKVDRLAICVSGEGVTKLLGVPIIERGTGVATADMVFETILDWNLESQIEFMSFDTTSVNTGIWAGASVLIQQKFERQLLGVACRHHVHELIIGSAFFAVFGKTTSPEVGLFKRFRDSWSKLDKSIYHPGVDDPVVMQALATDQETLRNDLIGGLGRKFVRNDYREVLQLGVIFLGGFAPPNYTIHSPGAMHHARWMSKVIYGLKIFLFREQFQLSEDEFLSLRRFVIFTIKVYLPAWNRSSVAAYAPRLDLKLVKTLVDYNTLDKTISEATTTTFLNHLWYLNPQLVGLAFFDKHLPVEMKRKMAAALKKENDFDVSSRANIRLEEVKNAELDQFVSNNTLMFFAALRIEPDFIDVDPDEWEKFPSFQLGTKRASSLQVVNDIAERAIALAGDFNSVLTTQEDQKTFLLQVVEKHRNQFPQAHKSTFAANLPN